MRVSNINSFIGGADNVQALDIIRGEKRTFTGTVKTKEGTLVDLTGATFSAKAEFYKADITEVSKKSITINNLAVASPAIVDKIIPVTVATDATTGKFTVEIPADLAADGSTSGADATNVLTAVIYVTYNFGSTKDIRKSRIVVIIRHSA